MTTASAVFTFKILPHKGPEMQNPIWMLFGEPYKHPRPVLHNGRKPR